MTFRPAIIAYSLIAALAVTAVPAAAQGARYQGNDFDITEARVTHLTDLDLLVFEQQVAGTAGATTPDPKGGLDGAPVLGYVFPTNLPPAAAGFGAAEGILALAVTSHPDFDDTPLWDENGDGDTGNDGVRWHTHWVVLVSDTRVAGGLSVREFRPTEAVVLPATNPGMPMLMDSPGFAVTARARTIQVVVPVSRMWLGEDAGAFRYDAVTCYLEVSAPGDDVDVDKPMLGVYEVFDVLSGDLSLPYTVIVR